VPPIPLPDPPLRDGGILLRPWREEDLPAALRGSRDPLVPRFTHVPQDNSPEHLRAYFDSHPAERASGEALHLAVADAEADAFLGAISLMRFAWEDLRCDIGYWLAPEGRGRGAATTATRLLARWALTSLGLERVDLHAATDNAASQRVAEAAGFVREGVLRSHQALKGRRNDMVVFGLVRSDLTARG
jgi:RimJ/RimL family protein N-acetyltransferase